MAKITLNLNHIAQRAKLRTVKYLVRQGEEVRKLAQQFVPVDQGNLQRAISVMVDDLGNIGKVMVVANKEYASIQEYGNLTHLGQKYSYRSFTAYGKALRDGVSKITGRKLKHGGSPAQEHGRVYGYGLKYAKKFGDTTREEAGYMRDAFEVVFGNMNAIKADIERRINK